jgi:transcriptional regulator with XRE-family HTH domain
LSNQEEARNELERIRFGEALAKRIEESDYRTVEEFAHVTGVAKSTMSRILHGTTDPRLSTLQKLASALGLNVTQLLEELLPSNANPVDRTLEVRLRIPAGLEPPPWWTSAMEQQAARDLPDLLESRDA